MARIGVVYSYRWQTLINLYLDIFEFSDPGTDSFVHTSLSQKDVFPCDHKNHNGKPESHRHSCLETEISQWS